MSRPAGSGGIPPHPTGKGLGGAHMKFLPWLGHRHFTKNQVCFWPEMPITLTFEITVNDFWCLAGIARIELSLKSQHDLESLEGG